MKNLHSTLLTILVIGTVGHISSDIYLPSLPAITRYFDSPARDVQLTMAIYLLGFSISHLFFGPLSDHIGRRRTLQLGLGLSAIATYLCMLAPSLAWLILGRFLQGFGMGATGISRAMLRDSFDGPELAKMASYLSTMVSIVVAIGPSLGGHLQEWFDWRASFAFLALYITALWLFVTFRMTETNRFISTKKFSLRETLKNYGCLLSNRVFIGYTLCAGFTYAGIICYITIAPFLLQEVVGLSAAQFGWLAVFSAIALACGAYTNGYYVNHKGTHWMMRIGLGIQCVAGLWLLGTGWLGFINTPFIVVGMMIFVFGAAFIFANATSGAFQSFAKMAGTAAALFGCLQIMIGSVASGIAALLHTANQIPIAIIFLVIVSVNYLALRLLVRYRPGAKSLAQKLNQTGNL